MQGRIALITGASRGIGAAVAKAYAAEGAHVILIARDQSKLEEVDDSIKQAGGQATLLPIDLQDFDAIDKIGPSVYERFGHLDVFVGNAGLLGTLMPLAQISEREFSRVMDVNITANFRLIKTLDPLLKISKSPRVIFVSTGESVTKGRAYWGTYAISKSALETMAMVYAAEVEQFDIKVNVIDPGAVRTDMRASAVPGEDPMTLPHPSELTQIFIDLGVESCVKHGEIISAR